MIYLAIVSFVLGIWIEGLLRFGIFFSLFILIVGLSCALLIKKESWYIGKIVLVCCLALVAGVVRMSATDTSPDKNLKLLSGQQITLTGQVVEEADKRDTSTRYIVSLDGSDSKVLLIVANGGFVEYGDRIKITGRLDLPKNFSESDGREFDYVSFLAKDKIHFTIWNPKLEVVEMGGGGIVASLFALKNTFVSKISAVVPEPNSSLLSGLIFGAKQSLGSDLLEKFRISGLMHVIVLSGYNLGVIAYGVLLATSRLGKRNVGLLISAIFIFLFALMVGLGATVVRASVMALLAILAKALGRPADALRWLMIALFLMLLWNPLSLINDPSLELSFMATLGLLLFSPIVYSLISRKLPLIPEKFAVREIIASTFSVQLFILPLLIRMSGEVSIISFVVNPLILPIVPFAMLFGVLTGFAGILPLVGNIVSWPFGILGYITSEIIIRAVELFSLLPFATVVIKELPFYAIILWYSLCTYIFFRFKHIVVS